MNQLFRHAGKMPVTLFFAFLCVALYAAMMSPAHLLASPQIADLIAWGGNYRPRTIVDQPWRLLTSVFLHGGLIHLAMNTVALIDLGYVLERKIGKCMMATVFLLSGISGALATVIWHPTSVGVGASGAIMGLAGALLVWLALPALDRSGDEDRAAHIRALFIGVALTLGVGALDERIDNAAHAGGLVAGVILGSLCYGFARARLTGAKRGLAISASAFAFLFTITLLLREQAFDEYRFRQSLPAILKNVDRYQNLNQFLIEMQQEEKEIGLVNILRRKKMVDQSFMRGINAWKTCVFDADILARMKITSGQKALAEEMAIYCGLRQKQYELLRAYAQKGMLAAAASDPALVRYSTRASALFESMLPTLQREFRMAPREGNAARK